MCVDNNVEAKIDIFMYSFLIFDFYLILETRFKKKTVQSLFIPMKTWQERERNLPKYSL